MNGNSTVEEFARRRTRQWIASIPGLGGLVLFFWAVKDPGNSLLGLSGPALVIPGAILALVYAVYSLLNWRCPRCAGQLGKSFNPSFCPRCGAALR